MTWPCSVQLCVIGSSPWVRAVARLGHLWLLEGGEGELGAEVGVFASG